MTVANIAVIFTCHVEPPRIVYPSILIIEDIVVDMCEGQYADQYRNAASKVKLPPQLWFVDFVL